MKLDPSERLRGDGSPQRHSAGSPANSKSNAVLWSAVARPPLCYCAAEGLRVRTIHKRVLRERARAANLIDLSSITLGDQHGI
jgi:hypothetical protein